MAIDAHGNVFKIPDYTIKEILSAIPSKCYKRSLPKSLAYVGRDIAVIVALAYAANHVIGPALAGTHWVVRFLFWNVYAAAVGAFSDVYKRQQSQLCTIWASWCWLRKKYMHW